MPKISSSHSLRVLQRVFVAVSEPRTGQSAGSALDTILTTNYRFAARLGLIFGGQVRATDSFFHFCSGGYPLSRHATCCWMCTLGYGRRVCLRGFNHCTRK